MDSILGSINGDFILTMVSNAVALLIAAMVLKGVEVKSFITAVLVAFIIAILNATIGEYLVDKTGFTHGILGFIVDAAVIMLASMFLEGFKVKGFLWALGLALILSVLNGFMYNVAQDIF